MNKLYQKFKEWLSFLVPKKDPEIKCSPQNNEDLNRLLRKATRKLTEQDAIDLVKKNEDLLSQLSWDVDKIAKQMQDRNKPS